MTLRIERRIANALARYGLPQSLSGIKILAEHLILRSAIHRWTDDGVCRPGCTLPTEVGPKTFLRMCDAGGLLLPHHRTWHTNITKISRDILVDKQRKKHNLLENLQIVTTRLHRLSGLNRQAAVASVGMFHRDETQSTNDPRSASGRVDQRPLDGRTAGSLDGNDVEDLTRVA